MFRPMAHLLLAALIVHTATAERPGGDKDFPSALFGAEDYGNPVDESLKDIERESLDWANQNVGSPYLKGSLDLADQDVGILKLGQQRYRGTHNLTEGTVDDQSGLILQQRIHVAAKRYTIVRKRFFYNGDAFMITRLTAHDLQTNRSDSGYVRIMRGGLGSNAVQLQLRSQRGKSLEYFVQIWGRLVLNWDDE